MKKRRVVHKKKTYTHARKRTSKHLHIHMIFLYSTMCIFGLTIIFAVMYTVMQPLAAKNTAYYSSVKVLGTSTSMQQPLLTRFLHILFPNINK